MRVLYPRQQSRAAVLAVAAVFVITACGTEVAPVEPRAEACVSWVSYETPADAMADAALVVRTEGPMTAVGTTELFGANASVHVVPVPDLLKGTGTGVSAGQDLEVVSTPVTCTGGGVYPEGDPLDASGTQILFLHWDEAVPGWRTITPLQGVVSATRDGGVPPEWPDA